MNDFDKRWRKQERTIRVEAALFGILITALIIAAALAGL
jgi:hypothetical protein